MTRLVLASVALALAATGPVRAAEVDPLLPEKSEAVMHFNVKQLMESDIVKRFALKPLGEQLKKDEVAAVFETVGIDPLKDVTGITQAIWEGDREKREQPRSLTILRGTFDPKKLGKAAETFANKYPTFLSLVDEAGLKMVRLGPPAGDGGGDAPQRGGQASYLYVADEKTVLIGTSPQVVADADKALAAKAKPKVSKELAALILKQDGKASMFACAVVGEKLAPLVKLIPNIPGGVDTDQLKEQLNKARTVALTLRVGKDVAAEIALGMTDADAAEGLQVNLNKLVDLIRTVVIPFGVGFQPKAKTLFDDIDKSLKAGAKKSEVVLNVKLSPEALAQLIVGDE